MKDSKRKLIYKNTKEHKNKREEFNKSNSIFKNFYTIKLNKKSIEEIQTFPDFNKIFLLDFINEEQILKCSYVYLFPIYAAKILNKSFYLPGVFDK